MDFVNRYFKEIYLENIFIILKIGKKKQLILLKKLYIFYKRILLMCALRAHNSKLILEKVYWELKKF